MCHIIYKWMKIMKFRGVWKVWDEELETMFMWRFYFFLSTNHFIISKSHNTKTSNIKKYLMTLGWFNELKIAISFLSEIRFSFDILSLCKIFNANSWPKIEMNRIDRERRHTITYYHISKIYNSLIFHIISLSRVYLSSHFFLSF